MKYYPRLQKYKASNLEFDVKSEIAYSYDWYQLFKVIDGVPILNVYKYSITTLKHVWKMRCLLHDLGYQNVLSIEAPKGLQDLSGAAEYLNKRIALFVEQALTMRKGTKRAIEHHRQLCDYLKQLNFIKGVKI